jgi:hypothetical protein
MQFLFSCGTTLRIRGVGHYLNQTPQIHRAEAFVLGCKFKLLTDRSKSCGCNYKEQNLETSLSPNALYLLLWRRYLFDSEDFLL